MVSSGGVVILRKQFIINHFWHLERNWVFDAFSDLGLIADEHGYNADIHFSEAHWNLGGSCLEQVWMVANFTQVHDDVHQVFHFVFESFLSVSQ